MKNIFLSVLTALIIFSNVNYADDGYKLWLKYKLVADKHQLEEYRDFHNEES